MRDIVSHAVPAAEVVANERHIYRNFTTAIFLYVLAEDTMNWTWTVPIMVFR